MRKRYQIQGNSSSEQPKSHVFLDTETFRAEMAEGGDSYLDTLRCWAATHVRLDGSSVHCRVAGEGTGREFWDWLTQRMKPVRGRTLVWGHNCHYDFAVLGGWEQIESGRLRVSFMAAGSGSFIIAGQYDGLSVVFLDSYGWLRAPLATVGEWIDKPKRRLPCDTSGDDEWMTYCRNDVDVLESAMMRVLEFQRSRDLGCFRYTAAAQSLQLWRHRLGPRVPSDLLSPRQDSRVKDDGREYVYPLIHSSEQALRAERESYYGPTCEAYRVGRVNGPVYSLDIQGCYPHLMGSYPYPVRLVSRIEAPSVSRLESLSRDYGIVASVKIRDASYEYPLRDENGSYRALGTYWTVLPGPELQYALDSGDVESVGVAYLYEERPIFAGWSRWVDGMRSHYRRRGDRLLESLIKTIANSLHGKFGQRSSDWEILKGEESEHPWGVSFRSTGPDKPPALCRSVGGIVQEQLERGEHPTSFPAIPAWVNSYARLEIQRLKDICCDDFPYYAYVDSLHVSESAYKELLDAGEVCLNVQGKLKVDAVYDWVHYYAPGRYDTSSGLHAAGLSKHHWKDERGDIMQWHYAGAGDTIMSQLVGGRPLPGVVVRKERYGLSETAGSRIVRDDGWTQVPVLNEGG